MEILFKKGNEPKSKFIRSQDLYEVITSLVEGGTNHLGVVRFVKECALGTDSLASVILCTLMFRGSTLWSIETKRRSFLQGFGVPCYRQTPITEKEVHKALDTIGFYNEED